MPAKKAKFKSYMNQQLSFAIALGAGVDEGQKVLRTAAVVLCISQSLLTLLALDKRL
jgi:hypothetical protein